MAKVRIYELARELQVQPKELLEFLHTIGVNGKVPSSSIEDTTARSLRQMVENKKDPEAARAADAADAAQKANATPATFKDFRTAPKPVHPDAGATEEVAADFIEDFRDRPDAPAAAPATGAPRPATSSPTAPVAPGSTAPAANGANGAAPVGPAPVGATPQAPAFNRGRRDFRGGGGRRGGRFGSGGPGGRFAGRGFGQDANAEAEAPADTDAPKPGDKRPLTLPPSLTIAELATKINQPSSALIKKLFAMNIIRSANQTIEADAASQLLAQFGYQMEVEKPRTETHLEEEDQEGLVTVPPVVTVMGHVDHGKTSLLDIIRSANVQRGEAGGITQRIGAYETEHNGERIVFLDTPGHAAFTRMRARGAHVTDIAILVVAADDGVMPQTREAIDHARAAKVPIIVAMNKMDRAEADPDRVKGELAALDLIPEDYGGDTVVIPVSAKTGQGVQEVLDMVLLMAEIQELKANPSGPAVGTVIEARQDPQKGPVATVLVHRGTLRTGDQVVVGDVYGRVRAMVDYKGDVLQEAGPKTPVSIMGLSAVPHASDMLKAVGSSREAREQAAQFGEDAKQGRYLSTERVSLNELFAQIQKGAVQELNLIVKADVQGSVEALCQSLEKLSHEEVRVKIIARGAGNVSESDVMLASASNAIIIAFAVGVETAAVGLADREKIEIRT
jgi:translation initiation factor IF-2